MLRLSNSAFERRDPVSELEIHVVAANARLLDGLSDLLSHRLVLRTIGCRSWLLGSTKEAGSFHSTILGLAANLLNGPTFNNQLVINTSNTGNSSNSFGSSLLLLAGANLAAQRANAFANFDVDVEASQLGGSQRLSNALSGLLIVAG